jgi:hypothetical protein
MFLELGYADTKVDSDEERGGGIDTWWSTLWLPTGGLTLTD